MKMKSLDIKSHYDVVITVSFFSIFNILIQIRYNAIILKGTRSRSFCGYRLKQLKHLTKHLLLKSLR